MTYSEFLDEFLNGLSQCVRWLKRQIFVDGNPFLSENLIFTIFAISIFLLLIEEILGLLTDFHFGGFILRRFGRSYGNGYDVKFETEYPKSYDVDYPADFKSKSYRAGYRMKYFISYNGKYYPFRHSRYNPFYVRQFNSAYKAGRIVSASQIYGQKLGNVHNSSLGSSYSAYSSNFNTKGLKGAFKWGSDLAQNAKDIFSDAWKKHKDMNIPVGDDLKIQNARAQAEEYTYNQKADWESLEQNESSSASWDGPIPPNLDISVDDDE